VIAGTEQALADAVYAGDALHWSTTAGAAGVKEAAAATATPRAPHHVWQPYDVQLLLLRGVTLVRGRVVDTVAAGMVAGEIVICGRALSAAQGEGGDSGVGGGCAAGGGGDAAAAAAAAGGGSRGSGSDGAIGGSDVSSKSRAARGRCW